MKKVALLIKHAADIEFYGNEIVQESFELFEEYTRYIIKEISKIPYLTSKTKYELIIKELAIKLAKFSDKLDSLLENKIDVICESESEWMKKFALSAGLVYTIPKNIKTQVKFLPYAGETIFTDISRITSEKIFSSVDTSLRISYATKRDTSESIKRIERSIDKIKSNLNTEVKTFTTAQFRNADRIMYKYNKQRVTYMSTLDSRTCIACAEYHGMSFDINDAPVIPVHHNCRCTYVPSGLVTDDDIMDFSGWIESLEDSEKKEVLGKSRYELYKSGVPVTSFVDDGHILTLDELNKTLD